MSGEVPADISITGIRRRQYDQGRGPSLRCGPQAGDCPARAHPTKYVTTEYPAMLSHIIKKELIMLTHAQHASPTAVICDNLEYFGGGPAKGDPDPRAVWDESEALAGLETVLDAFVEEIAPDGTLPASTDAVSAATGFDPPMG